MAATAFNELATLSESLLSNSDLHYPDAELDRLVKVVEACHKAFGFDAAATWLQRMGPSMSA